MATSSKADSTADNMSGVQHVVLILSGKGGVGKSTVAAQLALALRQAGKKVGILDVDLCGPSIPRMFDVEGHDVHQCPGGWVPVYPDQDQRLALMSIGFLLQARDDAVVWRGPKKNAMIKQFIGDVVWGELDYLIIDTPPGTSDEHISVVENVRQYSPDGAVLVTTPQGVAVGDVRRELTFCRKTKLPVLGVIENMSGFVCPHCTSFLLEICYLLLYVGHVEAELQSEAQRKVSDRHQNECTNVFSKGGGEALANQFNVPFLGCVPLDPQLTRSLEEGQRFVDAFPTSTAAQAIGRVAQTLLQRGEQQETMDTS